MTTTTRAKIVATLPHWAFEDNTAKMKFEKRWRENGREILGRVDHMSRSTEMSYEIVGTTELMNFKNTNNAKYVGNTN